MNSPEPPVALAVTVDAGRVLLVRRAAPEGALSWVFPGGKIEPGETAEQAAEREASEEAGVAVEAVRVLGERVHPETRRRLVYVACKVLSGEAFAASPREVAEVTWVTPAELRMYVPRELFPPVRAYLDHAWTIGSSD